MINLYLFRHAESKMNETSHLVGGRSNSTELTSSGEEQAKSLGKRLARQNVKFSHIYCSPATRTKKTAEIALSELSDPNEVMIDERLQELSQGEWEGKLRTECYTPETMNTLNELGWDFKAPGGESRKELEARMLEFLDSEIVPKVESSDKDLSIAVFSHGMAIKCLLRGIMDFDQAMTYKTMLDNTSITKLRFEKGNWLVESINDVSHVKDPDMAKAYLNYIQEDKNK